MALNGNFVAARVAADDMYPNRSAQEEIERRKWKPRERKLDAVETSSFWLQCADRRLISSGNFSTGTCARLTRFRLASSRSSDTVASN